MFFCFVSLLIVGRGGGGGGYFCCLFLLKFHRCQVLPIFFHDIYDMQMYILEVFCQNAVHCPSISDAPEIPLRRLSITVASHGPKGVANHKHVGCLFIKQLIQVNIKKHPHYWQVLLFNCFRFALICAAVMYCYVFTFLYSWRMC